MALVLNLLLFLFELLPKLGISKFSKISQNIKPGQDSSVRIPFGKSRMSQKQSFAKIISPKIKSTRNDTSPTPHLLNSEEMTDADEHF